MEYSAQLQKRYGAGYEHGIFQPVSVALQLIHELLPQLNVVGMFYVGPDGRGFIWFERATVGWLKFLHQFPAKVFRVQGTFEDGRTLLIERAIIVYIDSKMDQGFATLSQEGIPNIKNGPIRLRFTAMSISAIVLQRPCSAASTGRQIKYKLLNSIFWGTEMIPTGKPGGTYRGLLPVTTPQRAWKFIRLLEFTSELEKDLKNGLMTMLPTATVDVSVLSENEIQTTDKEINALCRLMSLVTDSSTTWVVRETWSENVQIEMYFAPHGISTDAADKSRYGVISNLQPSDGLKLFLESTVQNFLVLQDSLRLHEVIDFLEQARHQKMVHIQLAVEVLALELLSHAWCLKDGLTEQQLSTMNIESKLGRMRKTFSFIERGFTNDILRRDLRNPLIHSGHIPLLSRQQLMTWSDDLYLLALRLLFCILGYKGKYRDFSKNFTMIDAPIS